MAMSEAPRPARPPDRQSEERDRAAFLMHGAVGTYARRHAAFLLGLLVAAFAIGVGYRFLFDPVEARQLANYLRSGTHGVVLMLAGWMARLFLIALPHSSFGPLLRRLPLAAELAAKVVVMTLVLTIVAVGFQFILYGPSLSPDWFSHHLPLIVTVSLSFSLIVGVAFEIQRLVGGRTLANFVLGAYHRPVREHRIVMFLDLAGSTALAEQLGELRVHDIVTRFFFDIDRPIADYDGQVHAYVGDEVIVTWPLSGDPKRNALCLRCFFAIEERVAQLAEFYRRDFGLVPQFRGSLHAGTVVVSECGDAKRQIALFGDTMNVAARICEYCKTSGELLLVSADLLRDCTIPEGLKTVFNGTIQLRGRRAAINVHAVRRRDREVVCA
jgi:adenylate cyclase